MRFADYPNVTSKQNKTTSKIPDVLDKNKYSPLEVEKASEDDEEAGQSLFEFGTSDDDDRSPSPSSSTSLKNTVENNNPVTIIIGDSMIKGLRPDKISKSVKHKAQVKSFPDSTVEDLTHYIKPSLKRKPKNIIVHVGTNDLRRKSAKEH
jgi:hypothetical protein